jgi:hypothetical protein
MKSSFDLPGDKMTMGGGGAFFLSASLMSSDSHAGRCGITSNQHTKLERAILYNGSPQPHAIWELLTTGTKSSIV